MIAEHAREIIAGIVFFSLFVFTSLFLLLLCLNLNLFSFYYYNKHFPTVENDYCFQYATILLVYNVTSIGQKHTHLLTIKIISCVCSITKHNHLFEKKKKTFCYNETQKLYLLIVYERNIFSLTLLAFLFSHFHGVSLHE